MCSVKGCEEQYTHWMHLDITLYGLELQFIGMSLCAKHERHLAEHATGMEKPKPAKKKWLQW